MMPDKKFSGHVSSIAQAKWTPQEHGERRDDVTVTRRDAPPATSYVVRVQLEDVDLPFITGATAVSRIEAPAISLFGRVSHFLNGLFRFR
jgi:hypothetical protein